MKTSFRFEIKCVNDQYGNGWWAGLEPHPKKNIGYIIFQEDGKASLEVREIQISYTSEKKYESWQRSAVSEISTVSVDFGELTANVISLGVLVQGRNDWSGTSFTSTDGKDHPEDATWDEIFWCCGGALGRCPSCFNKLAQDEARYQVPEHHNEWTTKSLGQRCTACGQLWRNDTPVPRSWTKSITSLTSGIYSDDFMSEKEWLQEVFGVTRDSFPERPYGPVVVEHPELNHFDRISRAGTVMWAYPVIRLFWDGTWEVFNQEDAITRMKVEIRGKGHKLNRDTKKMIEMLRISVKRDPASERAKKIHQFLLRSDGRATIDFSIDEGDVLYDSPWFRHFGNNRYDPDTMMMYLFGLGFVDGQSSHEYDDWAHILFQGQAPAEHMKDVKLYMFKIGKKFFVGSFYLFIDKEDHKQNTRTFYFVLVTEDEAKKMEDEE